MKKIYRILALVLILSMMFADISVYAVEGVVDENTPNVEEAEAPEEQEGNIPMGEPEENELGVDEDVSPHEEIITEDPENKIVDSNEKKIEKRQIAVEEDVYAAEKAGLENSWRYKEGELIRQKTRYTQYKTWPKVPGAVSYGIDVSHNNGKIDWAKAKKAGVDYAIIRCGYGMNQADQDDRQWKNNVQGCIENDIPFGVYIYSYATTTERAKSEAEHVLRLVKGYNLTYPIYLDLEDDSTPYKDAKKMGDIAETFCDIIEKAGYEVGIYSNTNWFTNYLTDARFNQWERWVAQYNTSCHYKGEYAMWQCSSEGRVNGINGNVDLNVNYKDRDGIKLVVKDGKTYCYDGKQQLFGEQMVNGEWYYFDEKSGVMKTGWHDFSKKKVYYDEKGKMVHGEKRIDNKWYMFDKVTGAMQIGFYKHSNKIVYYANDGQMLYGEQRIAGKNYYFDDVTGAMYVGIRELPNGNKIYYGEDGTQGYGEQYIDDEWYYFDEKSGVMKTGWHDFSKKKVYYDENGKMVHGEKRIDNKWYMFDQTTGGVVTGFYKMSNKTVYYNQAGQMQYGEQYIGSHWYYFDKVTGGMTTGLYKMPNKTVYYDQAGRMQYGEQYIGGHWYYFDKVTGGMTTGLYKMSNKTVYYNQAGQMQYGEQYIGGHWYYFDKVTGGMTIGFYKFSNKIVYYNQVGQMQYGEQKINGKIYVFDKVTGAMIK